MRFITSRFTRAHSQTPNLLLLGAIALVPSVASHRRDTLLARLSRGIATLPFAVLRGRRRTSPRCDALPQREQTLPGSHRGRSSIVMWRPLALGLDPRLVISEGPAQVGIPHLKAHLLALPSARLTRTRCTSSAVTIVRYNGSSRLQLFLTHSTCWHWSAVRLDARPIVHLTTLSASSAVFVTALGPKPRIGPMNSMHKTSRRPARQQCADFVRPRRSTLPPNFMHVARAAMGGAANIEVAIVDGSGADGGGVGPTVDTSCPHGHLRSATCVGQMG